MKYKIGENKLERVIFKYLDNNLIIKETPYDYYFLENEDDVYQSRPTHRSETGI